jgi:hypothetical protein
MNIVNNRSTVIHGSYNNIYKQFINKLNKEQKKIFSKINNNNLEIKNIINSLLSLKKIDNKKILPINIKSSTMTFIYIYKYVYYPWIFRDIKQFEQSLLDKLYVIQLDQNELIKQLEKNKLKYYFNYSIKVN